MTQKNTELQCPNLFQNSFRTYSNSHLHKHEDLLNIPLIINFHTFIKSLNLKMSEFAQYQDCFTLLIIFKHLWKIQIVQRKKQYLLNLLNLLNYVFWLNLAIEEFYKGFPAV